MRTLLLLLTACATDPWIDVDDGPRLGFVDGLQRPPPTPRELELTVSAATPGEPITFTITGGAPGESVRLFRSRNHLGAGPCHPGLGRCLDITRPIREHAVLAFNQAGVAEITQTLPAHIELGRDFSFQAASDTSPTGAFSQAVRVRTEAEAGVPLSIRVTDLQGRPLDGARVEVDGVEVATTDRSGVIVLPAVAPGELAVRVEAPGRPPTAERFTVRRGEENALTVPLLRYSYHDRFDPAEPATMDQGGVRIDLPAGTYRDKETGEPVGGPIDLYVEPYPIGDLAMRRLAPGDWEGLAEGGEVVRFHSYGMAEISLVAGGRPVDLPAGATATLSYELPFGTDAVVGEEIPAWSFDESTATWTQEGVGVVELGTFGEARWTAEVEHFTWWNADRPWYETSCIVAYGRLGGTDIYLQEFSASAIGVDYNGSYSAYTEDSYSVCLEMLYGGQAQVEAYSRFYGRSSSFFVVEDTQVAAECPLLNDGQCSILEFEFEPPTCLQGTVLDAEGRPAAGVAVVVDLDDFDYDGLAEDFDITDADGHYCLSVPSTEFVDVQFWGADGSITVVPFLTFGPPGAQCGGGECEELNQGQPVRLTRPPTGCVRGRVVRGDQGFPYPPAPAGTPVYLYDGDQGVEVSCAAGDDAPDLWGALLSTAFTAEDGSFCVEDIELSYAGMTSGPNNQQVPYFSRSLSVVGGDCSGGLPDRRYGSPSQQGSCSMPERCEDLGDVGVPPEVSQ